MSQISILINNVVNLWAYFAVRKWWTSSGCCNSVSTVFIGSSHTFIRVELWKKKTELIYFNMRGVMDSLWTIVRFRVRLLWSVIKQSHIMLKYIYLLAINCFSAWKLVNTAQVNLLSIYTFINSNRIWCCGCQTLASNCSSKYLPNKLST